MMNTHPTIDRRIPHQYPFSFIDTIIDYQENEWIIGRKTISRNDRFSWEVYPVLICEALAQLSKLLETLSEQGMESISYLASIQIDFYELPKIGNCLELYARTGKKIGEMVSYNIEAKVREGLILKGRLFRKYNAI